MSSVGSNAPGGFAPPSFEDAGDDGIVPSTSTLMCPPRPDTQAEAVPLAAASSAPQLVASQPAAGSSSAPAVGGHLDDTRVEIFAEENAGSSEERQEGQGEDQSSQQSAQAARSDPNMGSMTRRPISWSESPQNQHHLQSRFPANSPIQQVQQHIQQNTFRGQRARRSAPYGPLGSTRGMRRGGPMGRGNRGGMGNQGYMGPGPW